MVRCNGSAECLDAAMGKRHDDEDREARHPQAVEALSIYEALVLAMERRREVFEVGERVADPDDARAAIQQLLGVSGLHARAVLDQQLRRFTVRDRARLVEERDRLRSVTSAT